MFDQTAVVANSLQAALFLIAFVLVGLGVMIAVRRVTRNRSTRIRMAREELLRPLVMRCLADDEPDTTVLDAVGKKEMPDLESLVWSMLTKVRGTSRDVLVDWLDRRGLVEKERKLTYSHSAVRRACAAERLGNAAQPNTARAIIRLLDDKHGDVRIVAARALGKMGNNAAVAPLLGALDGKRAVPLSIVTMALLHIGPSVVDPLIPYLGSKSENVRSVCAEILGMHGALSASRWLVLLVAHDPSEDVRARAANALGRIGSPMGLEVLTRACSAENPLRLRVASVLALGQIGGSVANGALQVALSDEDEQVSSTAAEALSHLGEQGADILALVAATEGPGQQRARDWLARVQLDSGSRRRRASVRAS